MSRHIAIIDTSVFVYYLRSGLHREMVRSLPGMIRNSSVVLAELYRGTLTPAERRFFEQLEASYPILVPTKNNWLDSGRLISRIRQDRGFAAPKLRDLHFDVLIALTARSYGARVITSNREDFETIAYYRKFDLEIWE